MACDVPRGVPVKAREIRGQFRHLNYKECYCSMINVSSKFTKENLISKAVDSGSKMHLSSV